MGGLLLGSDWSGWWLKPRTSEPLFSIKEEDTEYIASGSLACCCLHHQSHPKKLASPPGGAIVGPQARR